MERWTKKGSDVCISIVVIQKSAGIAQDKYLVMKYNTIARVSQMDDADPKQNQHVFDIYTLFIPTKEIMRLIHHQGDK